MRAESVLAWSLESATSARTSATSPIRSTSRPPRSRCHDDDARPRSTMPPRRSATTIGSVGSSITSAPLSSAAVASPRNPTAAAARASGRTTSRSARRNEKPTPASDTRNSANSAANRT
jgi:hypothetical protein